MSKQQMFAGLAWKNKGFHRSLVEKWRDDKGYRPKPLQPRAARLDALAGAPLNDTVYPVA